MCAGSVAGDIASKLTNKPGQVTFVGKNIAAPMSVSAQQSEDGGTVVVRVVNNAAAPADVQLQVSGESDAAEEEDFAGATATQLQSDSPADANPSWDVDKIAPKEVKVAMDGGRASLSLPAYSYTVVTAKK